MQIIKSPKLAYNLFVVFQEGIRSGCFLFLSKKYFFSK